MLLIGNGRLITRSETNPYLENGAVVLDGEDWDPAIHRELPSWTRRGRFVRRGPSELWR